MARELVCRGMTGKAFALILRGTDSARALMGIVAGDAAERAAALGVAPAARPANSLRADPTGVVRLLVLEFFPKDVTLIALFDRYDLGRGARGVDDGLVRKAGFDS